MLLVGKDKKGEFYKWQTREDYTIKSLKWNYYAEIIFDTQEKKLTKNRWGTIGFVEYEKYEHLIDKYIEKYYEDLEKNIIV